MAKLIYMIPKEVDIPDCPFCGSNKLETDDDRVRIVCTKCKMVGPECRDLEESIKVWERSNPFYNTEKGPRGFKPPPPPIHERISGGVSQGIPDRIPGKMVGTIPVPEEDEGKALTGSRYRVCEEEQHFQN